MAFDTPGVSIEYKTDGPLVIRAASTSTAVFIGPTVIGRSVTNDGSGDVVSPTYVTSLSEYGDVFSTRGARAGIVCLPTENNAVTDPMGRAVRGFFMNGGQNAYIVSTSATAEARASAELSITDGGGTALYRADAKSPGAWGNDVNIAVSDSSITGDFVDVEVSVRFAGDAETVVSTETFTGVAADDVTSINSNVVDFHALEAATVTPAVTATANLSLALDGGGNHFYSAEASSGGAWGDGVTIDVVDSAEPGDFVDVTITGTLPGDGAPTAENFTAVATTNLQDLPSVLVSFTTLGADPGGTPITLGNPGNLAGGADASGPLVEIGGNANMGGGTNSSATETSAMGLIFETLRDFDDVSIIVFPDRVWPTNQADYSLALAHCQRMKDRVTLIQLADDETDFANVSVPLDKFAAVYYPQARVTLPTPGGGAATATVNTTGHVAGIIARTDAEKGPWTAPAGLHASIAGITALTVDIGNSFQARMNPNNINALRAIQGIPVIWGARTRDQGGIYEYLPVMRTAILIGDSLRDALQRAVFAKNTEVLWANITAGVNGFMDGLFAQGAFQGATPGQAFRVAVGLNLSMSQADIRAGICRVNVAFAPALVAEFIEISIEQIFEPG